MFKEQKFKTNIKKVKRKKEHKANTILLQILQQFLNLHRTQECPGQFPWKKSLKGIPKRNPKGQKQTLTKSSFKRRGGDCNTNNKHHM